VNAGAVYILTERTSAGWASLDPNLMMSADVTIWGAAAVDRIGSSLAIGDNPRQDPTSKDDLLVGAPFASTASQPNAGKAYLVHSFPSIVDLSVPTVGVHSFEGECEDDEFGHSMALGRDADGDGIADILIGAPESTNDLGKDSAGGAYLFRGTGSFPQTLVAADAYMIFDGIDDDAQALGAEGDKAGRAVAFGSFGTGSDKVVIGAPGAEPTPPNSNDNVGEIYVVGFLAAGSTPLTVVEAGGGEITLSWGDSCVGTDNDYAVYEGIIGDFASHVPRTCTTGGATTLTFTPAAANSYYLVVPHNGRREGSYGLASDGTQRHTYTSLAVACLPRELAVVCQ